MLSLQLDLLQFLHKFRVAGVASHQLERTCHRINSSDVSLRKGAAQYPFAYCALSTIKMTTECSRDLCKIRSHFHTQTKFFNLLTACLVGFCFWSTLQRPWCGCVGTTCPILSTKLNVQQVCSAY